MKIIFKINDTSTSNVIVKSILGTERFTKFMEEVYNNIEMKKKHTYKKILGMNFTAKVIFQ